MMPSEDNCAALVEPPTEAEMQQAITGNMAHLMTVMRAVKRFKKLLVRKRPQFMEGIFGRDSRIVSPPHSVHGPSRSVEAHDRFPVESALVREGVHRDVNEEIVKTSATMDALTVRSETQLDGTSSVALHQDGPVSPESDSPHADHIRIRAATFPIDDHAKGHAHDPLEDRLYLAIGPGADVAVEGDLMEDPMISESPGGVDDDIYELAYQEEIKRILAERESAGLHLNRRVEHIERLRRHPNVISTSLNQAMDFAGTTARRMGDRARSGGFAALVRDARDKARATVAEAERSETSLPESASLGTGSNDDESPARDARTDSLESPASAPGSRRPSRSPRPETRRLRDYARASASQALKGMAKRIDETAARLDSRGNTQPYPET